LKGSFENLKGKAHRSRRKIKRKKEKKERLPAPNQRYVGHMHCLRIKKLPRGFKCHLKNYCLVCQMPLQAPFKQLGNNSYPNVCNARINDFFK
jgi:hypothetical protein